jgi:hypothetical protein
MVWYNPFTWGSNDRTNEQLPGERPLYCANPQCGEAFKRGTDIMMETQDGALTHPGECQPLYVCHKVFAGGDAVAGNFDLVSYDAAQKLAAKGKIDKVSLEARVDKPEFSFETVARSG